MANIPWVQLDTSPSIPVALKNAAGTAPYDLTGCTVKLRIKDPDTGVETNVANQACTIVSATLGTVTYAPASTDFPSVKSYTADIEITITATGKVATPFEQIVWQIRAKN